MEIKEYVKAVLKEVITAIEETEQEQNREMHLAMPENRRSIEFDIATTVENSTGKKGELQGSIKVLGIGIDGNGEIKSESKDSSTSRIKFGVYINSKNKKDEAKLHKQFEDAYQNRLQ